jgi:hypothetical protein
MGYILECPSCEEEVDLGRSLDNVLLVSIFAEIFVINVILLTTPQLATIASVRPAQ